MPLMNVTNSLKDNTQTNFEAILDTILEELLQTAGSAKICCHMSGLSIPNIGKSQNLEIPLCVELARMVHMDYSMDVFLKYLKYVCC